jgi:hypothetical protein
MKTVGIPKGLSRAREVAARVLSLLDVLSISS